MRHAEFTIGGAFWCGGQQWRCTDKGARTIVAIQINEVRVESTDPALCRTLGRAEAEREGGFNGPPYAVAEHVFDENDIEGCALTRDAGEVKARA